MPEAVIVDTVRTPIGRAFKGSLAQLAPRRDGRLRGRPAPRAQPRVSTPPRSRRSSAAAACRRACRPSTSAGSSSLLSEKLPQTINGVTVSRYCSSSLDSIRHAANAIKAGEGDTYIAAGVEWVSRYNERTEPAGADDQNEKLQGTDGQPNAYIEMGQTAVNVAKRYEVSRADMDKYAQRSQELAVQSQEDGFFDREIVPVTLPRRDRGRQGRRPARQLDAGEARRAARGLRRGRRHRRQLLPAQRRRRRGAADVGRRRRRSWA